MKEGFVHTFLVVIACIAIYNFALKPFLPSTISNIVGI